MLHKRVYNKLSKRTNVPTRIANNLRKDIILCLIDRHNLKTSSYCITALSYHMQFCVLVVLQLLMVCSSEIRLNLHRCS